MKKPTKVDFYKKGGEVLFTAVRVLKKPVKVRFYTKDGVPVTFKGIRTMKKELKKRVARVRPQRYFGITKVRENQKVCWISKHDKHGWSLGLSLGKRTVWLTGIRFKDTGEVNYTLNTDTVFVHLKGEKKDD